MINDKTDYDIVPDLLPPSEDGVFKTLLTHPDAVPVLRDVVESFLHFPVTKVEVKNVELPISDISEKRERFDVNCTVNDGSQFEVEMQANAMSGDSLRTNHKILKSRAIYYLCDLHSAQSGRDIRYDMLMRSYQVTICGYTIFPKQKEFVSRFSFRNENGEELSDAVAIILIELTKLADVITKPVETMTGEELWSVFFAYGNDPEYSELLNQMITARGEIKMAKELLQTISTDENERARFRARRKFEMDMQHNLIVSREEGIMEGEIKTSITIAKNLLKRNRPIDEILEDTGLTREEIESLCADN